MRSVPDPLLRVEGLAPRLENQSSNLTLCLEMVVSSETLISISRIACTHRVALLKPASATDDNQKLLLYRNNEDL